VAGDVLMVERHRLAAVILQDRHRREIADAERLSHRCLEAG
jgi:hypothetical protein